MRFAARLALLVGLMWVLLPLAPAPGRLAGHAAAAPVGRRLVEVGQVGGATDAVAAAGTLVAFGEGPRLAFADVTDPAAPRPLGHSAELGDLVAAVEIAGAHALVAAGRGGLAVVDARRPEAPAVLATLPLPGPARDVAVLGDTAFVAVGEAGLALADVADAGQPRLLALLALPRSAERVAVAGGYAYVMCATWTTDSYGDPYVEAAEVFVVDARDARHPVLGMALAGYDYTYRVAPVAAIEGLLLVGTGGESPALTVFDLANPARPVPAGYMDARSALRDIAPGGRAHTALVTSGEGHPDSGRVTEVNLANPGNPTAGTTWSTSEQGQGAVVAGSNGLAFATLAEGGFAVLGTKGGDSSLGVIVGAHRSLGHALAVDGSGDLAYVAAGGSGLAVVDLAQPARPVALGRSPAGAGGAVVLYEDVAVPAAAGGGPPTRVYAASQHFDVVSSALRVVDVSDVHQPRETGAWHQQVRLAEAVAGLGTVAYLGHEQGIEVIDAADPARPAQVRSVAVADGVVDLAVAGGLLYASGSRYDLGLYRLTTPTVPALLGRLELPGYALAVAVGDGTAFVATAMSRFGERSDDPRCWLHVIDVRAPATPTLTVSVDLPGRPMSAATLPGHVVVGLAEAATRGHRGTLLAFDVTTPAAPILVARAAVTGRPAGLAALGGDLLVAADDGGLVTYRWDWPVYLPQLLRAGLRRAGAP